MVPQFNGEYVQMEDSWEYGPEENIQFKGDKLRGM